MCGLKFSCFIFLAERICPLQTSKGLETFGCLQIWHTCPWSLHISVHFTWWNGLTFATQVLGADCLWFDKVMYSCAFQVVEYVGEIVGLRLADKRENEYQSGKRLQYKSACYFFRIDKEHIIDATRKGGIARFVNHSCLVIIRVIMSVFCTIVQYKLIILPCLFAWPAKLRCQNYFCAEWKEGNFKVLSWYICISSLCWMPQLKWFL